MKKIYDKTNKCYVEYLGTINDEVYGKLDMVRGVGWRNSCDRCCFCSDICRKVKGRHDLCCSSKGFDGYFIEHDIDAHEDMDTTKRAYALLKVVEEGGIAVNICNAKEVKERVMDKLIKQQVLKTISLGDHIGDVDLIKYDVDAGYDCDLCLLKEIIGDKCTHIKAKKLTGYDCSCRGFKGHFIKHIEQSNNKERERERERGE